MFDARRIAAGLIALALVAGGQPLRAPADETNAAESATKPIKAAAAEVEFFEKHIRPLLVERCHRCHGDLLDPEGGLALTSRAAILRGGISGPAAIAGDPDSSLLIRAVRHDELEMPPEDDPLTEQQIASLERWVRHGLPWPEADEHAIARQSVAAEQERIDAARATHWAFQPIVRPPLPQVSQPDWCRSPIDRFILARLEEAGLAPSPPADKRTLLRRLTFDLTGLPPTMEELDAFAADESPDAVERVVDRLLASLRYGERWARHWLDVARYADSRGHVLFKDSDFPWSYTYRDYVIRSLNADLPYDRFLVEQLAADKLNLGDDRRPLTALGFLTLGNGFMNNKHDVIDDRIDVVTRGLMGLTVSCARCHDHKYDAIPTRDYYSLYGVFASSTTPLVPPLFEEPPKTEAYRTFAAKLTALQQKLDDFLQAKFDAVIATARSRVSEYLLAAHDLKDRPPTEDFMFVAEPGDLNPTMIVRYQVYLARTAKARDPIWTVWHALGALRESEFSSRASDVVARTIADEPVHPLVASALSEKPPSGMDDVATRYGELLLRAENAWQEAVEQSRAAGRPTPATLEDPDLESLRQVFYHPDAPAGVQRTELTALMLLPDRKSQNLRGEMLKEIEKTSASDPAAPPRAMVLEDLPVPTSPRVLLRGNPNQLGDEVPRRFLRVLCADEPEPFRPDDSGRLDLARAIVDPNNPLTARVIVNRVWHWHFGKPLVGTPSDFGVRSEPPSHPELLDWLADDFMRHGWSLKHLHRRVLLSASFAQTSTDRADGIAADPSNVLLWRMNRRRLDFEATSDAMLAVAGRLEPSLGGPSRKNIADPTATCRTMYGYIDRRDLPGVYLTFDFPSPDATSPKRSQTTIPQQALFMMNHPLIQSCAKHLATRASTAVGDTGANSDAKRARMLFRLALGRDPNGDELGWSVSFLRRSPQRAQTLHELAQGLLMTNEFVFVD